MPKNRIVERPWGKKRNGGWVIQRSDLLELLKKGDVLELDKVLAGTATLRKLVNLLPYEDCLITANGRLEIETVQRVVRTRNGHRKFGFQKPKHYHQFMAIFNGAWVPRGIIKLVVLKPRKF